MTNSATAGQGELKISKALDAGTKSHILPRGYGSDLMLSLRPFKFRRVVPTGSVILSALLLLQPILTLHHLYSEAHHDDGVAAVADHGHDHDANVDHDHDNCPDSEPGHAPHFAADHEALLTRVAQRIDVSAPVFIYVSTIVFELPKTSNSKPPFSRVPFRPPSAVDDSPSASRAPPVA